MLKNNEKNLRLIVCALCMFLVGLLTVACESREQPKATTTPVTVASPSPDSGAEERIRRLTAEGNQRRYESKLAEANQALRVDSNNVLAYCQRAEAHQGLGKYDEAIADCNMAILLDPKNVIGYERRASVYHKAGQYDLAIADYTKAIAVDPIDPGERYYERGKIHHELGRYDAAIADYNRAIKFLESDEVYYSRAEAFYKKGNLIKAKADIDRCLQNALDGDLIGKARALLAKMQEESR